MKMLLGIALVVLAAVVNPARAADQPAASTVTLETAADRIVVDRGSGRLLSLRAKNAPDVELIAAAPNYPAFALDYLGADGYHQLDSHHAKQVSVHCTESGEEQTLTAVFSKLGGLDLDVTLIARASKRERLSRWSVSVRNGAGLRIANVQFPFFVVPLEAKSSLLLPQDSGHLRTGAGLDAAPQDDPGQWRDTYFHFPGFMFAQFMACYTDRGGVYLACEDTEGNVKVIKAVKHAPGMRLGIAHVGDWPKQGERKLEYDVVLGSFSGDWYDAADLYRNWSLKQKWATPLAKRTDVPKWLLDSPVYITVRPQGYMDDESMRIAEFLPYEKCIPMLENIAKRVESPLSVVLMAWERGGPWVYPDCFPLAGGDESITRFCSMAKQRGWNVGSFCNGTRWITGRRDGYDGKTHKGGYDGKSYYETHHGEQTVCRHEDGGLDVEDWGWRVGYRSCMAQPETRRIAVDFVKRLVGWGMESIQFFDQNCNASTLPCFASDHGHPAMPGKWMATAMADMVGAFRKAAADAGQGGVIQSTENPCNEYCLPLFQECDVRTSAGGSGQQDFVPVFHYLYHECIVIQGMMSTGPEPYSIPIRTAWNGVYGGISGAVMTGDGTLLNRDTLNWAPWTPKVGKNDDAIEMLRTMTAMRRGPGRDFLVFGRMQHPAKASGIDLITWEHNGQRRNVSAVAHAAWQTPDGRYGVVLANWTSQDRSVVVAGPRLGASPKIVAIGRRTETPAAETSQGGFRVTVPSLGCALIAGGDGKP